MLRNFNALVCASLLLLLIGLPAAGANASPTPTHFVNSAIGSDTNPGTAVLPWRSLNPIQKTLALWSGDMVVQVTGPATAKGIFSKVAPHTGSTLTIQGNVTAVAPVAQTIGGDPWTVMTPTNVGTRAQIEPSSDDGVTSAVLGPTGLSAPDLPAARFGAWALVKLSNGYSVWRAPKVRSIPNVAAWATSRGAMPRRIPVWHGTLANTDPSMWANAALNPSNVNTNWGLFTDATYHYLITPPDHSFTNPNSIWFWASYGATLYVDGPDVTIKDLSFIAGQNSVFGDSNASRMHLIGDDFRIYGAAVEIQGTATNQYASNITVEQSHFSDDGNWKLPGASEVQGQLVGFSGYKTAIPYGTAGTCSCFRTMESVAILGQGGSMNSIYQDNTVEGGVDGMDLYPVQPGGGTFDLHAGENQIIQRNLLRYLSDDAFDYTGNEQNLRLLNNRTEYTATFLSLAWSQYGPITVTGNVAWQTGSGARPGGLPIGYFFKMGAFGGTAYVQPQVTVSHNTFWTNDKGAEAINPGGGDGANIATLLLDHNIVRQESNPVGHIVKVMHAGQIVEDYNDWSEASQTAAYPFETWLGNFDTITAWRAASGQGLHSNVRAASLRSVPDGLLVAPTLGDVHVLLAGLGAP